MTENKVTPLSFHGMTTWRGRSGRSYAFWAYGLDEAIPAFPGIFAFAVAGERGWNVVFLGETENFARAVDDSAFREAASEMGATHVLLHCQGGSTEERMQAEGDLVTELEPALNRESRGGDAAFGDAGLTAG